MEKHLAGTIAGFMATAPMTLAMETMHRQLPPEERYPLPPRQITMNVADEFGVEGDMDQAQKLEATLAAHFAYGAACGTVYAAVSDHLPGPPVVRGIGFGLAVWTGSYLGLLPATGLLGSAKNHPIRRSALMIAAHVAWGAATGVMTHAMSDSQRSRA